MGTTVFSPVRVGRSWTRAPQALLVALAVLVLLAASFVLGRISDSNNDVPTIVPSSAHVSGSITGDVAPICRMGRPC